MGHRPSPDQCQQLHPPDLALSVEPAHLASWTYCWNNANVNAPYCLSRSSSVGDAPIPAAASACRLMQKPLMVTDYRGHRRTLFPVREINLKAYADAILTQITWSALGFEPRAMQGNRPSPPRTVLSHEDRAFQMVSESINSWDSLMTITVSNGLTT